MLEWLETLSLPELIAVVIVVVEVFIVLFALLFLVGWRRKSMREDDRYDEARNKMSALLPELDGANARKAIDDGTAICKGLSDRFARRLLTELAEYMTVAGAEPLAEIFLAVGLGEGALLATKAQPWRRLRTIREARALNDPADLLDKLVKDDQPDVRISAFEALCALGRADEGLFALRRIVNDGRLVRTRATDAIANTQPLPIRQLANMSEASDALLRHVCIGALGRAGCREAIDVIIGGVTDDDVEVRIEALRSLKELGDSSALTACLGALKDEFWEVRSAAVGTCAELGGDGAAGPIGALLDDSAEWVRHNAAVALGRCGPAGIAHLRQAAASGNENAQSSLAALRLATEGE